MLVANDCWALTGWWNKYTAAWRGSGCVLTFCSRRWLCLHVHLMYVSREYQLAGERHWCYDIIYFLLKDIYSTSRNIEVFDGIYSLSVCFYNLHKTCTSYNVCAPLRWGRLWFPSSLCHTDWHACLTGGVKNKENCGWKIISLNLSPWAVTGTADRSPLLCVKCLSKGRTKLLCSW